MWFFFSGAQAGHPRLVPQRESSVRGVRVSAKPAEAPGGGGEGSLLRPASGS